MLGELNKFSDVNGNGDGNIPACSIVPQSTTLLNDKILHCATSYFALQLHLPYAYTVTF
jgi:hypothetical protein